MTPYICLWHSNRSHTSQHWKAWEGPCAGYTDVCVFSKQTLKNLHKNVFNAGLVKSHSAYLICFLKWLGLEEWRRIRTHRHRLNCRLHLQMVFVNSLMSNALHNHTSQSFHWYFFLSLPCLLHHKQRNHHRNPVFSKPWRSWMFLHSLQKPHDEMPY